MTDGFCSIEYSPYDESTRVAYKKGFSQAVEISAKKPVLCATIVKCTLMLYSPLHLPQLSRHGT